MSPHLADLPALVAAYDDVADAFEEYDSSLYEAFGEMTPLDIYGSDDDEGEDDEDGEYDAEAIREAQGALA